MDIKKRPIDQELLSAICTERDLKTADYFQLEGPDPKAMTEGNIVVPYGRSLDGPAILLNEPWYICQDAKAALATAEAIATKLGTKAHKIGWFTPKDKVGWQVYIFQESTPWTIASENKGGC